MEIDVGSSILNLPREGVVSLRDAGGTRVLCLNGSLWVTQERRREDVVLGPGESLRVSGDGLTLVTALRPSELRVVKPCAAGRALLRRVLKLFPTSLSSALPSI